MDPFRVWPHLVLMMCKWIEDGLITISLARRLTWEINRFDGVTGDMSMSPMFRGIQGIAKFWYYLMQNHATADTLLRDSSDRDLFSVSNSGSGLQSVRYLGPALVVLNMDTLSERKDNAVMEPSTWQGLFPRIAT